MEQSQWSLQTKSPISSKCTKKKKKKENTRSLNTSNSSILDTAQLSYPATTEETYVM